MRSLLLLIFIVGVLGGPVLAQSPQTINPSDSLETRRLKENSNFSLLNSKASSAVAGVHAHANKNLLDTIPVLFGDPYQFLRLNATHDGFEWATITGGTGITVSNVGGTLTISLNAGNGITSLNGLTGGTQTFTNDTNIIITSGGTAHVLGWSGQLAPGRGGTGNAFFHVLGPASTVKDFTFPNVNAAILSDAALVTVPQGGSGASSLTGLLLGNGTSPFTGITTSSALAAVISDKTGTAGGLVFSIGPSLTDALFSGSGRFTAGAESRYYNTGNTFYVGFKAGTLAANKIWVLPTGDGTSNQVLTTDGSGNLNWSTPPGASGGEANTASNAGSGSGWFKTKSGVDLVFKSFVAGSSRLSVTSNTNDLTVDVVEANLNRANMTGTTPVGGGGSGATTFTAGILKSPGGTGAFATVTAPSGAIVGDTDTQTLDHKTINAEATGNIITTVGKIWLDAASCDGGTSAGLQWDTFSTAAPVAACLVGTNTIKGVADFADGVSDLTIQRTIQLPGDFTGNVDVAFKWLTTATSGNVIWGVAVGCAGDASLDDPTFNPYSDTTDLAKGTANQLNDASVSSINTSGCTAGKLMHIKVARRLSQSGDTVAASARLVGVEITLRRAQ